MNPFLLPVIYTLSSCAGACAVGEQISASVHAVCAVVFIALALIHESERDDAPKQ